MAVCSFNSFQIAERLPNNMAFINSGYQEVQYVGTRFSLFVIFLIFKIPESPRSASESQNPDCSAAAAT